MILILTALALLAAISLAIWAALGFVVADRVVRPRRLPPTGILSVTARVVTLDRTALSAFPGPMGLLFDDERHHVGLDRLVELTDTAVVRELAEPATGPAEPGLGRVVADPFGTPTKAGLSMEEIHLSRNGTKAPAWLVTGEHHASADWAIHIHGAMSGRESMLRTARSFADQGFTSLLVTYRGDDDVIPHLRASTLGQTEWRDVEAAVSYALEHGARRIMLVGMSLGATIALSFTTRSSLAASVGGLVLVAPMVDWRASVHANVRAARLPGFVAGAALWWMSHKLPSAILHLPEPLRLDELDFTVPGAVNCPTLVIHTKGDPVAPYSASERMKHASSALVTLEGIEGAHHALEWNENSDRFSQFVADWLTHITT